MRMTVALAVACVAVGLCVADESDAAVKRYELDIPRQTLDTALKEFARQTGLQIARFSDDGHGSVMVGPVSGEVSARVALETLLAPSGLTWQLVNERTIAVMEAGSGGSTSSTKAAEEEGGPDSGNARTTSAPWRIVEANVRSNRQVETSQIGPNPTSEEPDEEQNERAALEEIIVTGTHIRGVGIVGAASQTFDREELNNTGYMAVADFFRSLPQNLAEISADAITAAGSSAIASANGVAASSVSLRGLGPGSTLVLLNGRRRPGNLNGRAVDVSAIPMSMVERIEIVTGAGSAIYGSDAVAGIVNLITRTAFDGAESQVYYGESPHGAEQFTFSQTLGRKYASGGFVVGYDYRKEQALDATDAGVVTGVSTSGRTPLPGLYHLRPPSEQHVGLFAGHFNLSDNTTLYGDVHFSTDHTTLGVVFDVQSLAHTGQVQVTDSDQYSFVAGLRVDVGDKWQVDISALQGVVDNRAVSAQPFALAPETITSLDQPPNTQTDDEASLTSLSAIADGPIGELRSGTISAAVGVELRNESYERTHLALPDGTAATPREDRDRDVSSIFAEIHLPLIDKGSHRLEASLAGRYDDYSDFGGSFTPRIGIDWRPINDLRIRGSYAKAFRAPDLFSLDFANQVIIADVPDPLNPEGERSVALGKFGGNAELQPEEADSWTVGIDWEPSERSRLSLTYFNIEYVNRIGVPNHGVLFTALTNEHFFPRLVDRNPTSAEVNEILSRSGGDISNFSGIPFDPATDDPLTAFPGLVLFDARLQNISIEEVDGVDVQVSTTLETASGDWSFGLDGTHYFDFTRNVTPAAPAIDQLNQPGKPVDLKLRGHVGWLRSAWNVNAYVNYVDSYSDTIAETPTKIDSWTTVDLTVIYDFSKTVDTGIFSGFRATLGVNNVLDEDPPLFLSNTFGIRYDAVNADAVGRYVSLRLCKRW